MDLKVTEKSKTRLELQIEKEDFSIPDIIHQEMLKDPKAAFAGVNQLHPILKRYIIEIEAAKTAKPINILTTASDRAVKNAEAILKEAQHAFEEAEK